MPCSRLNRAWETSLVILLLLLMAGLMWRPIHEESATLDEPVFLAAGYSYLNGYGLRFDPEQPPLAKELSALPLLFTPVNVSDTARRFLQPTPVFEQTRDWHYELRSVSDLYPQGRNGWYHWPVPEAAGFGNLLLFDGTNDADQLLVKGRLVQVALTLLTGLVIFFWIRRLAGQLAALLGLALWSFNPLALAYGHLILTDMGAVLGFILSIWTFSRFLHEPTLKNASLNGVATGIAFLLKITALLLPPTMLAIAVIGWITQPALRQQCRRFWKLIPLMALITWAVILLGYFPDWKPAPYLTPAAAAEIGVPGWFQALRPCLIPARYFKGVALQLGHSALGHDCYLFGQWGLKGWWYYYPVALALKSPIPWLLCLGLVAVRWKRADFARLIPWLAAACYMAIAMNNKINIGVRHILPAIALITVGMAVQLADDRLWVRWTGFILAGWLGIVSLLAWPYHIQYFNELAGGPANGWRYLADSNLDWGQDVKRLQLYMIDHNVGQVFVDIFGARITVEHDLLNSVKVTPEEAKLLKQGILVVSASRITRPEWQWLRDTRQPIDCVAYTQFIYDLGAPAKVPAAR